MNYTFQGRFIAAIASGQKTNTIRKPRAGRARHVKPGETIQHYTGQRMKPLLFGTSICESVSPIEIRFDAGEVRLFAPLPAKYAMRASLTTRTTVAVVFRGEGLEFLARADGFESWDDMCDFWRDYHPDAMAQGYSWAGDFICWKDFRGAHP